MEITKVNVPVKCLGKKCLNCPSIDITCNEINYGKEIKQYVFECKNLHHCLFLLDALKEVTKETGITKK